MGPKEMRVGLLLNGLFLQVWQVRAVEELQSVSGVQIVVGILPEESSSPPAKSLWSKLDATALYRWYRKRLHIPQLKESSPEWLQKLPLIRVQTVDKKGSNYFSDSDLNAIRAHNPDVLLRFGFNILRGEVLRVAPLGIWSFHHGDEQFYRGGPPAFWEILHGKKVVGSILQKLTEKLDGGIILKKGCFPVTLHSLSETHNRLLEDTALWPAQVARDVLNGVLQIDHCKAAPTEAPVYRFPRNLTMLQWLLKSLKYRILFHWNDLCKAEQWNVAVLHQAITDVPDKGLYTEARWLSEQGANHFRADAFGVHHGEEELILYEAYDYESGRGEILAVNEQGETRKVLPDGNHHRSYPFVFCFEGETYCMPECFESNRLDVFKWNPAGRSFSFFKTLLHDIPVIDATLCEISGKWWIFCTRRERSNYALELFHAHHPMGPFEAHANNPVKWDVRSSRPAGNVFEANGHWYRPAQDCSETYGGRIVLFEILEITEKTYAEHEVRVLHPIKPYKHGIHTLADYGGKRIIIDGKRYRFSRAKFWRRLKAKLGMASG